MNVYQKSVDVRSLILLGTVILSLTAPLCAAAQTPSDSIPVAERIDAVNAVVANRMGVMRDSARIDACALLSVMSGDARAVATLRPWVRERMAPDLAQCGRPETERLATDLCGRSGGSNGKDLRS